MAGFLNKKDRLIDYKLTENGRKQLASGDIRFKYYTFSDRSINYEASIQDNKIVSDSEFYYLPFEVTTNPGLVNNPEYYLSSELTFDNIENNLFQTNRTQSTLAEILSSQRYLTTKKITNNSVVENNGLSFSNIKFRSEIDFIDSQLTRRYPTIKFVEESVKNLKSVKKDKRFSDYIKNKKLIPQSSLGNEIIEDIEKSNVSSIDFIFKTLDLKNNIKATDSRKDVIIKSVNKIEENKDKIFCFDFELNNSYMSNNDVFSFEIHNIDSQDKLKKLPVVNLGNFFDNKKGRYVNVYLIGKFFKKNEIKEVINKENKTYQFEEISDYYFINLFTLVAE